MLRPPVRNNGESDAEVTGVLRTTLPGGLRVVTEFVPSVRSASVGVWVGVEDVRVVTGVLARGEGVQLSADGVDGLGDLDRRARRSRLEQKMFEEVGGAGHAMTFVA